MEVIDKTEFTARVAEILIAEQTEPDLEILDTYVKATYPDLRKCINMIQQNCRDGKLMPPASGDSVDNKIIDYKWLNCLKLAK